MDYMRYSRAVIVLEEKDREFADRPGEEMKGYLRVETGNNRGAFRCVIQNVKYYPRSEYTYQLILFGTRGERTIHTVVGTIPISRYGTGEVYLRFHPNDVDGQGNDYGHYTTAIVAAVSSKNRTEQLHPVLIGRTGHFTPEELRKSQEPPSPVSALAGESPAEETSSSLEKTEPRRTFNHYYGDYLKRVCQYLWSVSGYYREVRPFQKAGDLEHVRWLKINDPAAMFLVSPGAKHFTERYGHFLLGMGEQMELSYYIAVPGKNCPEDQPDGGDSGFLLWLPLNTGEGYGYWILGIDGKSGEIFSCETL